MIVVLFIYSINLVELNPTVQLLQFLLLTNFPSGSSINYHEDKLYLLGDDARNILVLDTRYQAADSIQLFDYPEKRIPKSQKADFESSAIVTINGIDHLLVLGSGSTERRKNFLLIPLTSIGRIDHTKPLVSDNMKEFIARLTKTSIRDVNIEGAFVVGQRMVLANRGIRNHSANYLILSDNNFWVQQDDARLNIVTIELPEGKREFLGISDLCYVESRDMFLFTFTSEATTNAYDDGVIGSSYIGWVNNVATKLNQTKLKLDGLIDLSGSSPEFKNQKIEGICMERESDDGLLIHLISDNDNGESKLFRILLKFDR